MHLSQHSATVATWAGLVVTTAASPVNPIGLHKRDPESLKDVEKWCEFAEDLKTIENAERSLERTTLGESLGIYIRTVNYESDGWLENFYRFVYQDADQGGEEARTCALLTNDCILQKGQSCRQAFSEAEEEGITWIKEAFWIWRAVRGAHTKLKKMRDELFANTIMNSLNIDKIADDFEANLEDDSFTSDGFSEWITTAMGLGGTALGLKQGLAPGYGAGLSVLSTAFSLITDSDDEEDPATVDRSEVQHSLSQFFNSSIRGVEQTARLAVGRAWEGESYDLLPVLSTEHEEQVANFYDDAFWLLDDDIKPVHDVLTSVAQLTTHFVVDMIIKGLNYAVAWETSIESSEDCGDRAGRRWLDVDGEGRCFTFVSYSGDSSTYYEVPPETNLFELMGGYGIDDLDSYYLTSIACAKSGCETSEGVGAGSSESDLPLCFYSLPVLNKTYWESGSCEDQTSLIGCERSNYVDFVDDDESGSCE